MTPNKELIIRDIETESMAANAGDTKKFTKFEKPVMIESMFVSDETAVSIQIKIGQKSLFSTNYIKGLLFNRAFDKILDGSLRIGTGDEITALLINKSGAAVTAQVIIFAREI